MRESVSGRDDVGKLFASPDPGRFSVGPFLKRGFALAGFYPGENVTN